jgi:hypothetical protein
VRYQLPLCSVGFGFLYVGVPWDVQNYFRCKRLGNAALNVC